MFDVCGTILMLTLSRYIIVIDTLILTIYIATIYRASDGMLD